MTKLDDLKAAIGAAALEADCARCPLARGRLVAPEPATAGTGHKFALTVVGEAPGQREIVERRPFVGASGKVMMQGLERACDLKRSQVHWTNAVLCSNPHGGMPKNQMLADARAACENRLLAETEDHDQTVIAAAGAEALQSILGRRKQALKWRGTVGTRAELVTNFPQVSISSTQLLAPLLHPAFVFRAPQWRTTFWDDFRRLGRVLRDGFAPPEELAGRQMIVVRTIDEWRQLGERLRQTISFDVETDSKSALTAGLVCFGVSDGPLTLVLPWKHFGGLKAAEITTQLFSTRRVVTHNGPSFDHLVAERFGIYVRDWTDTLIAVHTLESHLPKNLQSVASRNLDVPPWKELEDRKATDDRLYKYNGRDALYDLLTWQKIEKRL